MEREERKGLVWLVVLFLACPIGIAGIAYQIRRDAAAFSKCECR